MPLVPGERVLSWGRTPEGWYAVATTHALHRRGPDGDPCAGLATPYAEILRARWDPETSTLDLIEAVDGSTRRVLLTLDEPGLLPETVRERVQCSILASRRIQVRGSRGVTVVARRPPAGKGPVAWQVSFDTGIDESDPAVADQVDAARAELRATLGV